MTKNLRKLMSEARDAGLAVVKQGQDEMFQIKRKSVSVVIWPDGSITRGDVQWHLARRMTQKEARSLLGI